jgi:hypothetical protein
MPRGLSPLVCNAIEQDGVIPDACKFLNPTLHLCPDWNGMLIDNSDIEIERCRCKGLT